MNGPIDDQTFDEYLQRGSSVSQHYRALDSEDVPPDVDAAVLARASDVVRAPHADKRRAWRRWSVPVALAASTVLAISVVLESGVRHDVAITHERQAASAEQPAPEGVPAPAQSAAVQDAPVASDRMETLSVPAEAPQSDAGGSSDPGASSEESRRADRARPLAEPRAPAFLAPAVESESTSADVEEIAVTGTAAAPPSSEPQRESPRSSSPASTATYSSVRAAAQRHDVPPAAPQPGDAAAPASAESTRAIQSGVARDQAEARKVQELVTPEKWLEQIRALREAGDSEQADREWREFREVFPDYEVAEDDRAWPARP